MGMTKYEVLLPAASFHQLFYSCILSLIKTWTGYKYQQQRKN